MPLAHNGDVSIYFETFGDSSGDPTLLLVNGLGSQCINYKVEWCEKFVAAGFHVIRFDNRDVGWSSKLPAESEPYALADMAGDAVAVLDAAGVGQAHVHGVSMGGMIVQQLAIDHPSRVLSMTSVMLTTSDRDVGHPSKEALALLMGPPPVGRDGFIARHLEAAHVYGSPELLRKRIVSPPMRPNFMTGASARKVRPASWPPSSARPARTSALGSLDVPALVLHGDQDKLVDISGGRRTAEAIPGARMVVMAGMGHGYPPQYWDRWVSEVASLAGFSS